MVSKLLENSKKTNRELYKKYAQLGQLMLESGDPGVLNQLPEPEEIYMALLAWASEMQKEQKELDSKAQKLKAEEAKLHDLRSSLMATKREWQTKTH